MCTRTQASRSKEHCSQWLQAAHLAGQWKHATESRHCGKVGRTRSGTSQRQQMQTCSCGSRCATSLTPLASSMHRRSDCTQTRCHYGRGRRVLQCPQTHHSSLDMVRVGCHQSKDLRHCRMSINLKCLTHQLPQAGQPAELVQRVRRRRRAVARQRIWRLELEVLHSIGRDSVWSGRKVLIQPRNGNKLAMLLAANNQARCCWPDILRPESLINNPQAISLFRAAAATR